MQKGDSMQKTESNKIMKVLVFIFQAILVIALAGGVAYGYCGVITMQEGSMEPTITTNEKYLIDKVSYKITDPKRGDIIAFKRNSKKESSLYIKRIIGLPGETILIRDGIILINNEAYVEKKKFPLITNPGMAEKEIQLGGDEYFVLGDNRNSSEDSRFIDVGNITKKNMIGKIWFVVAPFDKIGFIKN